MNVHEMRQAILKKIIGDQNIKDFADRHGINASYVSQILNGVKPLGDNAAIKMETSIGLQPGTLSAPRIEHAAEFEEAPQISRWRTVDIKGTAQLGDNGFWCELEHSEGRVDVITTDPDAYALRVKGDSMTPAIRNGWVVWCEPNRELVSGEYVMVKTVAGECMVKELLFHNNEQISLMSINDQYQRLNLPVDQIEKAHYVGGIVPPSKIKY